MLIANYEELAIRLTQILTKSKKILRKAKKLTNLGTDFFFSMKNRSAFVSIFSQSQATFVYVIFEIMLPPRV